MTTPRTHFAFRIIARTAYGRRQLAASSDFTTALAAYRTACECWPKAAITLRQGARVIEDRPVARQRRFFLANIKDR